MRTSPVFLLVTSALALGQEPFARASSFETHSSLDAPCRARAWVRAPNLTPGQILQGDVKVKLDGSCDQVSRYTLGLRFAERSWVKTRRAGAVLPERATHDDGMFFRIEDENESIYDDHWSFGFPRNLSAMDQYKNDSKNPALWLVREEERIAFETRYDLSDDETQVLGSGIDKSFALLVPSTNYPPALAPTFHGSLHRDPNAAGAEHICRYFVDVTFANGTSRQLDAGYTSFDAVVSAEHLHSPVSINVTAFRDISSEEAKRESAHSIAQDEFTLEVSFPDGTHLEQGSTNNIMIISHQLGPGSQRALSIAEATLHVLQKNCWAPQHAADSKTAERLGRNNIMWNAEVLQPKSHDRRRSKATLPIAIPPFSQDILPENGTMFSTEPVVVQFTVPPRTYLPFEMFYQTWAVELQVLLFVRNLSDPARPDTSPLECDEEYDWTPTIRSGPDSLREDDILWATVPISVYQKREKRRAAVSSAVHYLSPEARAPVFVDPSSLPRLLQMTAEERDGLAPLCLPQIVARADEEVVKDRYHARGGRAPQAHYYVGDTWLKKMLAQGEDLQQGLGFFVQVPN